MDRGYLCLRIQKENKEPEFHQLKSLIENYFELSFGNLDFKEFFSSNVGTLKIPLSTPFVILISLSSETPLLIIGDH